MPAGHIQRRRMNRIHDRLRRRYGRRQWKTWGSPVNVLVETILSQNTTDSNSSSGYRQLRRRFKTWNQVADASVGDVERCIRICGLSRIKAPRIQEILSRIRRDRGRIELDFLRRYKTTRAYDYLRQFPGVGPKTAGCVLLFSLRRAVFPVDTHILRITKRLGFLQESATLEGAHEILAPLISPSTRYEMHILLIAHGREICRARNPRCDDCCLMYLCAYGKNSKSG
jgi:endonuclease-3